jgi:hypothetical protein
MLIRAGFELAFKCAAPTPLMLQVRIHPEREPDLEQPEYLKAAPYTPYRSYIDAFARSNAAGLCNPVCSRPLSF